MVWPEAFALSVLIGCGTFICWKFLDLMRDP